jgi:tetratricopeptide (TPR) repeat protein
VQLEKVNSKIFDKKVRLIYEYNRNSPLFVKMANSQIEENNIDEAVEILRAGLKTYPEHPVAYLLLGKAFALMGNYGEALQLFKKGSDIIQSDDTYDFYLKELESIKKQRSLFETSSRSSFFNQSKSVNRPESETDLFKPKDDVKSVKELTTSIDERLSQLAKEISKAKLSTTLNGTAVNTNFTNILSKDNLIVSETLAKIYVAQNEYDEAIKVYEKLIKKEPERYEHYTGKIKEIRSKLIS